MWRAGKRCSRWAPRESSFWLVSRPDFANCSFFQEMCEVHALMRGSRRTPSKTMVPSWTGLVRMRIAGPTGDLGGPTKCERLLNFCCNWFLQEYLADLDFSRRSHGSRMKFNEHRVVPTFIKIHCPRRRQLTWWRRCRGGASKGIRLVPETEFSEKVHYSSSTRVPEANQPRVLITHE